MVIGGALALLGGSVLVFAGLVDQGQALVAVGVGIMAAGIPGTLWSARREANADESDAVHGASGSTRPPAG